MEDHTKYKEQLISEWASRQHLVRSIAKWHKGPTFDYFPDKLRLRREGMHAVSKGWVPAKPIINAATRVLAVGSCFARNFTIWLAEHGFNRTFPESAYNALLRFNVDFESAAVVAQQFRWAFENVDPANLLWIDKSRQLVAATDVGRKEVRATLEQTDVLILTLGLSEVWYDTVTGEPLWRTLTEDVFDPKRHVFKIESVAQTTEWLEAIERIRRSHLPNLKIIFTISPIPLTATFRPVSALTANSVSKAILRSALDEFLRRHDRLVNKELFYFPSYELVTNYFIDPFQEDNRHIVPIVPGTIISFFVQHFCDASVSAPRESDSLTRLRGGKELERVMQHSAIVTQDNRINELLIRIAELEEDKVELQSVCDARLEVIEELDKAAKERLRLLQEVHHVAEERLSAINQMEKALEHARKKTT
jgi:hypothetical protein